MDWEKPPKRLCDQFRSWQTMEKYFGIKQPGTLIIPFKNLPKHIQEAFEQLKPLAKMADDREAERIKLN